MNNRIVLLTQEVPLQSIISTVSKYKIKKIKLFNLDINYLQKLQSSLNSRVTIEDIYRSEYDFKELIINRSRSYNFVDNIYQELNENNDIPLKWASRFYNHLDIEAAFKKELINKISNYFEILYFSKVFERRGSEVYALTDNKIYQVHKILKKSTLLTSDLNVQIKTYSALIEKIKSYLIFIFLPLYIFSKFRLNSLNKHKNVFDVAIRLHKTIGGVSNKYYLDGCDALTPYLNNKNISYVYVAETLPDPKILSDIKANKDQIKYTNRLFFNNPYLLIISIFRILKEHILNIAYLSKYFFKGLGLFDNLISKLYFDYCKWTCFCENNKISWYVSTNDEALSSLNRNIILLKYGVKTAHYSQSWTGYYYLKGKDIDFREPNRAFSLYHTQFYLSGRQKKYHQSHNISFVESFISGPLVDSSTQYKNSQEDSIILKKDDSKKIISVFTASYLSVANTNGEVDLIDFLNFVVKASKDKRFNNFEFLIRFKHRLPDFETLSAELQEVLGIIFNCNNIVIADSKYSASFMISVSSFVISMAFTGPTIDALFARVPACYYSTNIQTSGSILDKCNGLIIRNVNDANNSLCMFRDFSDQDFDNYYTNELPIDAVKSQEDIGFKFIANKIASI